jgi:dihydropteroate synthase-like protein
MTQPEHLLFLTGKLAEPSLRRVLDAMQPTPFTYVVHELGVSVAALMTTDMIARRLKDKLADFKADRIIVPGRCRGDIEDLSRTLNITVERGPEEVKDLPQHFGQKARAVDLSKHDMLIFAEMVDAPQLSVDHIVERALQLKHDGADVIDIGCLPNTAFTHLEDSVKALKSIGLQVSVDSMQTDELLRGGKAGADYLLSLNEHTLWVLNEVASIPILVSSNHAHISSAIKAVEMAVSLKRRYFVDPILDPIHFGFTESIVRYRDLRRELPDAPMMMGIGNLTELTHADTMGMTAMLLGIASELKVGALLTTQVSGHARRAVREADVTRRVMYAAREQSALPRYLTPQLMALHERQAFLDNDEDIRATAAQVRDPNFRIQVSDAGIYAYNRDGVRVHQDPFAFYPQLAVEGDAGHAFYLGVELARAQIAWQLGKRYTQDEPLQWGCAVDHDAQDLTAQKTIGTTLSHKIRGLDKSTDASE